jgi:hypothetical protein
MKALGTDPLVSMHAMGTILLSYVGSLLGSTVLAQWSATIGNR